MKSQFINRAFRRMWALPDAVADRNPAFVALMYHGRDTGAYQVAADNSTDTSPIAPPGQSRRHQTERPALADGDVLRINARTCRMAGECSATPTNGHRAPAWTN